LLYSIFVIATILWVFIVMLVLLVNGCSLMLEVSPLSGNYHFRLTLEKACGVLWRKKCYRHSLLPRLIGWSCNQSLY